MHLLQRIPVSGHSGSEAGALYVRTRDRVSSYDTYFGAFAVSYWREITAITQVQLRIVVSGGGRAELVSLSNGVETVVHDLAVSAGAVQFPALDVHDGAYEAWFVRLTDCQLVAGGWWTQDAPAREVRLNGVITTFNRHEYVNATVRQFDALAAELSDLVHNFRLTVDDNAQNLNLDRPTALHVEVVGNPNLGGAGGFARGLVMSRRGGWATHVLFMDDDIAVEPEALIRTVALLQFATDPMCCVHGAMISEDQPWLCVEAGADYVWKSIYPPRPLHHLEDLRDREIALAGKLDRPYAYSAWWYTAFPIALTNDNPLPVFIRGDDVAWGLMHTRGHIQTLPGIGVWHADFDVKNVPAAVYYEIRNITLASLLSEPRYRWWHFEKRFLGYAFLNLFSMRYLSTEYLLRGMTDFFAGPDYLLSINHAELHRDLYGRDEEKSKDLTPDLAEVQIAPDSMRPTSLREFLLSLVTLGGALVPARLRRNEYVAVPVQKRAIAVSIRHDRVVHRHPRQPIGFVAVRDGKRFWSLLSKVVLMAVVVPFKYGLTARQYKRRYGEMVSDATWERFFSGS